MFGHTSAEWGLWFILFAGGYLIGSVHFCRAIPLVFRHIDITKESADGNPGAANVFTLCGWQLGLCCLFCDMAKGFLPVFAAVKWMPPSGGRGLFALVMMGPVLGHAFSVLHGFRGGKCIAVIFGEMIALLWITPVGLILAALYIFFSVAVKIDPHSRRSMVTFGLFIPAALVLEFALVQPAVGIGCAGVSCVSIVKHAANRNPDPAKTPDAPDLPDEGPEKDTPDAPKKR